MAGLKCKSAVLFLFGDLGGGDFIWLQKADWGIIGVRNMVEVREGQLSDAEKIVEFEMEANRDGCRFCQDAVIF